MGMDGNGNPDHPCRHGTSAVEKGPATKSDKILEKVQTAFDPPLIFGKFYCRFFMIDMVAYMRGGIMTR